MPWRTIMSLGSSSGSIMKVERIKGTHTQSNLMQIFASMMHTSTRTPTLSDTPDVTCPSDLPDSERRKEVVHR